MLAQVGIGDPNLMAGPRRVFLPVPPEPEPGVYPTAGYESQVGQWRVKGRGRTGKRYRIWPRASAAWLIAPFAAAALATLTYMLG